MPLGPHGESLGVFFSECVMIQLPLTSLVISQVYIGGQSGATNMQILKQHGITHILNAAAATCMCMFPQVRRLPIQYFHFSCLQSHSFLHVIVGT